jgi:hypothetical protein
MHLSAMTGTSTSLGRVSSGAAQYTTNARLSVRSPVTMTGGRLPAGQTPSWRRWLIGLDLIGEEFYKLLDRVFKVDLISVSIFGWLHHDIEIVVHLPDLPYLQLQHLDTCH